MVGRLGTSELAAIAMAGLYCHILHTFLWPLSTGTMAIAARRYGKQIYAENTNECFASSHTGEVLGSGFLCAAVLAFATLIISFSGRFFISHLTSSPSLAENALDYIQTVRWMFPFVGVSAVATGFLSAVNRTGPVMTVNIGANVLNIVFNYIFIFGKFGFPAMGIKGAALGTVLAEVSGAVYLLFVLVTDRGLRQYNLSGFLKPKKSLAMDIVRTASPIAVQNIVALSVFLVYESIIGSFGTMFLASIHIVFSVFRINKTIVGGFARAGAILAGNYLGAGRKESAERIVALCALSGIAVALAILTAVLLLPSFIAGLFTADEAVISASVTALRFFSFFFFIEVIGYTFEIIFSGIGWGRFVLFSEFTTNMIFMLGMTWICVRLLGLSLVWAWTSYAFYQVAHAAILTSGWLSGRWLNVKAESGR